MDKITEEWEFNDNVGGICYEEWTYSLFYTETNKIVPVSGGDPVSFDPSTKTFTVFTEKHEKKLI